MRILFVSYYLPPLLYPQSIQIGRFLEHLKKDTEFDITVVTAKEESRIDKNLYPNILKNFEVISIENSFNLYLNILKNKFLWTTICQWF